MEYTEEEIQLAIIAHNCTREEAISTHCATVRAAREAQRVEARMETLRQHRNRRLAETDWTQNRDVSLSNDSDWTVYRQALRDITDTYNNINDVVWPTKPE